MFLCRAPIQAAHPHDAQCGVRVGKLGRSSVRYEIGLFRNEADTASAQGHFVHVYVDRATHRPVPIPADLQRVLEPLLV